MSSNLLLKPLETELEPILVEHQLGNLKSPNRKMREYIIDNAINFLYNPGISVLLESKIAINTIKITSMHDPTEGGIITGLEELALASNKGMEINYDDRVFPTTSVHHLLPLFFRIKYSKKKKLN